MTANRPALRSQDEIQRAHDLLHPIVSGEASFESDTVATIAAHAALDVLCWVLHHDDNDAFANNLKEIEGRLREHGIVMTRMQ